MTTSAASDDRRTPPPTRVEHPTVAERVARGRAERERVRRADHAGFSLAPDRPDPISLLQRQAETRVPELVPIRHGRMLTSPFAFYRGAALIMAGDLAASSTTGLRAQLCGDAHLSNFGVFGTPERRMVFDINDFDETLPGPFEWDVKRLAASLAVAGRDRGFTPAARETVLEACLGTYRAAMAGFAEMTNLEVFYASLDIDRTLARYRADMDRKTAKRTERALAKARGRDSMQALGKLTREVNGEPRITSDPPLVVPVADLMPEDLWAEFARWMRQGLRDYRRTLSTDRRRLLEQYRFVDLARKVVGVGSVGTRAWIVLMLGRDVRDPLFLQFKEAQSSVLDGFAGRSEYRNSGHRVVAGQRLMQAASDVFLGWIRLTGPEGVQRDFYVRQLRDWKGSADVQGMVPAHMAMYGELCGWTLARAHARSGDRVAIAAYLGGGDGFARAITTFAERYADQNERDFGLMRAAVADGRLTAETGV